jgi:hypothetical protein
MPGTLINPSGTAECPLSNSINPATGNNQPIVLANTAGQTQTCGGTGQPVCDEAAFYQNKSGTPPPTPPQQLVVFCANNKILYEEVTPQNGTTTSYPIANNISGINF